MKMFLTAIAMVMAVGTMAHAQWGGGGGRGRGADSCRDIGWGGPNASGECSAPYRNDDSRFRRDQNRFDFESCRVARDSSGDRFYFCRLDRRGGGHGGGHGGWNRCERVGWSTTRNGVRECSAGYRNDDMRFYRDQRYSRLHNCIIHRDSSGDRFYFCDIR